MRFGRQMSEIMLLLKAWKPVDPILCLKGIQGWRWMGKGVGMAAVIRLSGHCRSMLRKGALPFYTVNVLELVIRLSNHCAKRICSVVTF